MHIYILRKRKKNSNYLFLFNCRYKSRGHFPGPIESQKYKVTFQVDKHALEVAVKAKDLKEKSSNIKMRFQYLQDLQLSHF